jgi:hypothetical protein
MEAIPVDRYRLIAGKLNSMFDGQFDLHAAKADFYSECADEMKKINMKKKDVEEADKALKK